MPTEDSKTQDWQTQVTKALDAAVETGRQQERAAWVALVRHKIQIFRENQAGAYGDAGERKVIVQVLDGILGAMSAPGAAPPPSIGAPQPAPDKWGRFQELVQSHLPSYGYERALVAKAFVEAFRAYEQMCEAESAASPLCYHCGSRNVSKSGWCATCQAPADKSGRSVP
jgi:hypothetical protein